MSHIETSEASSQRKLKIVVVGAGLGGLSVGVACRPFADVTILDSASELKEFGAALAVPPNASKILRKWGGSDGIEERGGMVVKLGTIWDGLTGNKLFEMPGDWETKFGGKQIHIHRADLQAELYELATNTSRDGNPCEIHLNTKVVTVDPETGEVKTEDERTFQGDIVVVANGIRSPVRDQIFGPTPLIHCGHSAYRLLVKAGSIVEDPELAQMGLLDHRVNTIDGHSERIIGYATSNQTKMNLVCMVADYKLKEFSQDSWSAEGTIPALVKSYSHWAPVWQRLLSLGTHVQLWRMADFDPLDTWVKSKCILLGDAAHAMLSHQAQGAALAIEDAEALGFVLGQMSTKDEIPSLLERWQSIRYKRATEIQQLSRVAGPQLVPEGKERRQPTREEMMKVVEQRCFGWRYDGAEDWEKNHPEWLKEGTANFTKRHPKDIL